MGKTFKFPDGFLWGATTSAHQVEGGNHNDWSEWEKANAERLAREAKSKFRYLPSWPQIRAQAEDPANYISGRACDHYNRFRQDFDIAKSLGHSAHRFSLEWSRIEPEEGRFDEKEIEHYRQVIQALRERDIEPFVTLWHWTIPLWLRDIGGIESRRFPFFFSRFCRTAVQAFRNEVTFWMTLNEPTSVIANSYTRGVWPPQRKNFMTALRVYKILARAHDEAYNAIHQVAPEAKVGFANILIFWEPYRQNILDQSAVAFSNFWSNEYFHSLTKNTHDYLALQYYFRFKIQFPRKVKNANQRISDMGWELYPAGLHHLLKRLQKYSKPIYITENGLADGQDRYRSWFIQESLRNVALAIQEGVDVRGYFYWSLLDNFEWDKGFWPRFGLVEVDYKTMGRKIRPSAWEYRKIIEMNAIEV